MKNSVPHTLADMVIIVTGGTSGIGRAAVDLLAKEVRGIVVFSRSASPNAFSGMNNVMTVAGDIASPADNKKLLEQALAHFGRVDALVNCAGIFPQGNLLQLMHEDWRATIETNLNGFASACRTILPHMIENSFGRIINVTSRLAETPKPGMSAYVASKAAATQFMKCLASELQQQGHTNILVNDLIPGSTKTGMNPSGQDPAIVASFIREILVLPAGSPTGKTYFQGKIYDLLK